MKHQRKKKFKITIRETLERQVNVRAHSFDEAMERVRDAYRRGKYVLTADNFTVVGFSATEPGGKYKVHKCCRDYPVPMFETSELLVALERCTRGVEFDGDSGFALVIENNKGNIFEIAYTGEITKNRDGCASQKELATISKFIEENFITTQGEDNHDTNS